MECEKCQDRGFTEENHGLIMVLCDCETGQKMRAELGFPEVIDDSNSGVGQPDTNTGSDNTSEPKQPSKQAKKRRSAKKSRKTI